MRELEQPSTDATVIREEPGDAPSASESIQVVPLSMKRDEDRNDEANPDEAIAANPQWGSVSMLSMAASMTEGLAPEAVVAANYNQFRARDLHDEFNFTSGGGTLESYFREALEGVSENGKPKDEDDNLSLYADIVADEREEQRREQEEWQHSQHELAGVSMTGEEWGELADAVGENGSLHQKMIDYLMAHGKTADEAKRKTKENEEIYRLMQKPKSQLTEAEQARIDQADKDPEFRATLEYAKSQRDQSYGQTNAAEKTTTAAEQTASVSSGADAFETPDTENSRQSVSLATKVPRPGDDSDFPSAPDLQEHHRAALAATKPLDAADKPERVAAIAPTQAPGSGFDV